MKENPEQIFVCKDFTPSPADRIYLTTLVKLGLIEECWKKYKMGKKYSVSRATKAYRFKKNKSFTIGSEEIEFPFIKKEYKK